MNLEEKIFRDTDIEIYSIEDIRNPIILHLLFDDNICDNIGNDLLPVLTWFEHERDSYNEYEKELSNTTNLKKFLNIGINIGIIIKFIIDTISNLLEDYSTIFDETIVDQSAPDPYRNRQEKYRWYDMSKITNKSIIDVINRHNLIDIFTSYLNEQKDAEFVEDAEFEEEFEEPEEKINNLFKELYKLGKWRDQNERVGEEVSYITIDVKYKNYKEFTNKCFYHIFDIWLSKQQYIYTNYGGYFNKNSNKGHSIGLFFEKIKDDEYEFILTNSGEGLNRHDELDDFPVYNTIVKNTINKDQVLNILVHILDCNGIYWALYRQKEDTSIVLFYTKFEDLNILIQKNEDKETDKRFYHDSQLSGSCTFYSTYYFIYYILLKNDKLDVFEEFILFLKVKYINSILVHFLYIERAPNKDIVALFNIYNIIKFKYKNICTPIFIEFLQKYNLTMFITGESSSIDGFNNAIDILDKVFIPRLSIINYEVDSDIRNYILENKKYSNFIMISSTINHYNIFKNMIKENKKEHNIISYLARYYHILSYIVDYIDFFKEKNILNIITISYLIDIIATLNNKIIEKSDSDSDLYEFDIDKPISLYKLTLQEEEEVEVESLEKMIKNNNTSETRKFIKEYIDEDGNPTITYVEATYDSKIRPFILYNSDESGIMFIPEAILIKDTTWKFIPYLSSDFIEDEEVGPVEEKKRKIFEKILKISILICYNLYNLLIEYIRNLELDGSIPFNVKYIYILLFNIIINIHDSNKIIILKEFEYSENILQKKYYIKCIEHFLENNKDTRNKEFYYDIKNIKYYNNIKCNMVRYIQYIPLNTHSSSGKHL